MTDEDHPLTPLGRAPAPGIDAAARDRIDASLRVAHAGRAPTRRWQVRMPRLALIAPALVVVLVSATVVMLARDESAVAALELRDARNVVVILPNGDQLRDPADGLTLVDGTIVEVGVGGAVTIDDVTLSAGTRITVRDGALVTDVIGTSTTRPGDDRDDGSGAASNDRAGFTTTQPPPPTTGPVRDEPDTAPSPTSVGPVSTDAPRADRAPTEDPTRDSASPDDDPLPADRPEPDEPVPADRPEPDEPLPADRPEPDEPVPADRPEPDQDSAAALSIALRLTALDARIVLAWRVDGLDDRPWTVAVIRTTDGSDPDWPLGSGVVVAESAAGELVERRSDLPEAITSLRYRVVVLDEAGGVVGRGAVQTLGDR